MQGKYYVDYVERIAKDQWEINAMSIIGLLDRQQHRGGVYSGDTVAQVLTEFFGGTVGESENGITPITGGIADCYVEDAVAATTVHGLLPVDSKRNNLHQLLFAYVITITKDANGDLLFSYLGYNDTPPEITDDRIYIGGKMAYEQPVTDVELTEYTYVYDETAERETVYDNTSAPHIEGEGLVEFSSPINPSTIQVTGSMTVRDANAVSAYVTGNGVITAIPYQVQSRVLTRSANSTAVQNSVSVSNVTLINPLNSSNVMDKLFEFYTQRKLVNASVILDGEKAGNLYQFTDPYGEVAKGYIHRMGFKASSIIKADCEIVTNYKPAGVSTNMQNVVLLTGSGVWTVPPAIKQRDNPFIRAVIIQGGQGGQGGRSGASSQRNPDYPGAGGAAGAGGSGGKALTVDIDVTNLDSIAYSCGEGGEGGASDQAGAAGGETTFGSYSSANGAVVPGGVLNLIDGKFYAKGGSAGLAGAAGGKGGSGNILKGSAGGDLTANGRTYKGGYGGNHQSAATGNYTATAMGGGGGGAAYGANGGNGGNGYAQWQAVAGGSGGTGATATISGTDAQYVGCGGNGGNGGGGGGAPGAGTWTYGSDLTGRIGTGGAGSKGGNGAPGGILIYY